ncbi:cytochrome P450 2K1-like [Nematolebias whitei]|uniref:cytochrome P450 2K1-like n=1 Tax=Nematolebias whitei TaxID=451745 RepID=UPI0018972A67|nr:cytochrome P450 2K1-like [Nematolebias whitei]
MFEDLQSPTSVFLLGVIVALLVLHLLQSNIFIQKRREPPGPRRLPLFGNLFQVDLKWLDKSLFEVSKQYGPVFQVYFGPKKVVVLAGYRTVKQALVNKAGEFGTREIAPIFHDLHKRNGVAFSNGDAWKETRRFVLTTLRDFGMGKKMSEEIIIKECCYLIEEFEQFQDNAFSNTKLLNYAASNVISALMFGKRFDYKDPVFQAMVERDNKIVHLAGTASIWIYNIFPWLGPFLKNWRDLMKIIEDGKMNTRKIIAGLKETLNPDACRCFVDAFLIHKKHLEDSGITNLHYHDDNLLYTVMNLFEAGTDTTATTVKWGLLYMAKFPHIQDHVQEELSRVVGSRQVRIEDRKNLPFTDAVVHETQRFANIFPLAVPHVTSQDVTLQGYFIKEVCSSHQLLLSLSLAISEDRNLLCIYFFFFNQQGSTVFPLLTSVLYDESEWESPHSFNPSHFLDKEGRFIRRGAFMPFSAGRRACLGESLARMELFLFFTSLLQHFRFTASPGASEDDVDLTPVVGFSLCPRPQKLCAIRRK